MSDKRIAEIAARMSGMAKQQKENAAKDVNIRINLGGSDETGKKVQSGSAKPLEGIVYALEQLLTLAKGGQNYCMLVVDGCWVNFRFQLKNKKKFLYCQVAGDKYIPKKSHLSDAHVKILNEMGITKEPASVDIFSTTFPEDAKFLPQIVKNTFRIFNDALRVSKGSTAYLELVLGSKPTPETEGVLAGIAKFIPDRREKNKFYWKWT